MTLLTGPSVFLVQHLLGGGVEEADFHLELPAGAGDAAHHGVVRPERLAQLAECALAFGAGQLPRPLEGEELPDVVGAQHLEDVEVAQPAHDVDGGRLGLWNAAATRLEVQHEQRWTGLDGLGRGVGRGAAGGWLGRGMHRRRGQGAG